MGAKVRSVLGWRKAQVKRGPVGCARVSGAPDGRDHAQLCCAVEVERIWPGGDVHFISNGEDRLETDALFACNAGSVEGGMGRLPGNVPINPRVELSAVLVLAPMSHMALTLSAEKPSSLHSKTTRLSPMVSFSEGMTPSAYVLSSAFCINSSKKCVFLLYRSLESRSSARSSLPRSPLTAGEGVEPASSYPCCSRMMRMSLAAAASGWAGLLDMMEAN